VDSSNIAENNDWRNDRGSESRKRRNFISDEEDLSAVSEHERDRSVLMKLVH
jgi:hypothetical protein